MSANGSGLWNPRAKERSIYVPRLALRELFGIVWLHAGGEVGAARLTV